LQKSNILISAVDLCLISPILNPLVRDLKSTGMFRKVHFILVFSSSVVLIDSDLEIEMYLIKIVVELR